MINLIKIILEGAFENFKRIFFAYGRVTDMDMRNAILNGEIKPEEKVAKDECIGCGGCANVCPTGAVTMKKLSSSEWLADGWSKNEIPELDSEKCVVCYYCHDFCPVYSLFGEKATIHPNAVGEVNIKLDELLKQPVKVSDDKLNFISQYLSDKTIIKNKK